MNKDVFGNLSKYSQNWVAGPTHMVRRQQVPGYTGHIRGMVNRDSMSKSYARVTATLFARKHPIDVDNTAKGRFSSTQRDEFRASNNRRFGKCTSYPLAWLSTLTILKRGKSSYKLGSFHKLESSFLS